MPTTLTSTLYSRLRLLLSISAGLVCYFLLSDRLGQMQRLLIGWNVWAWLYLCILWIRMLRTDAAGIRRIAQQQDQSAALVLGMVIVACVVSMVAILSELPALKSLTGTPRLMHLLLTALTLIASWAMLPTAFAMHYAHQHYLYRSSDLTPLIFPEKKANPGYWDFLYFSFTIAVASQTADVATGTTALRRLALLQSVISFIFNLAILGLSVNVGAGLLN
ncbi:DUF1345 domain-containing protein [Pantoea deleyi]|uniref:DUF1345 domain-containing protein n=1 Tax=Pantoea deleyi TaxID=470932 RepID=UPI0035D42D95